MFTTSSVRLAHRPDHPVSAPRRIATVCVFGGARNGHDPDLAEAADSLGAAIALAGLRLVYGGGCDGLMGRVAMAAAHKGGAVVAITPHYLIERMTMLARDCQTISVPDLGVRKQLMFDYADGFVALPGGIGTVEELTEVMTLRKLDRHAKPLVLANFKNFWQPLLGMFDALATAGFMQPCAQDTHMVADTPDQILPLLHGKPAAAQAPSSAPPRLRPSRHGRLALPGVR